MEQLFFRITESKEIANRKKMAALFGSLPPGSYLLTVKPSKQRSNQQNRFWWGYIVPTVKDALREAGFDDIRTDQDCHELLKAMFFKKEIVNVNTGEILTTVGSTTEATTVIFAERIAEIQKWASDYLGVVLLDPGQRLEIDFTP